MVKKRITDIIIDKFQHKPTKGQYVLIDNIVNYIEDLLEKKSNSDEIFILKGYAGTGKTSIISALVNSLPALRLKSVLLAPTGRAAKVFALYSGKSASTIHKKIYRQKTQNSDIAEFAIDQNLHKNTLFIVDESSMISNSAFDNSPFGTGRVLDDLISYVYNGLGCKLILVGDTAQLPPVKLNISPALDISVMKSMGFDVVEVELTDVVRQSKESGVLHNATMLRNRINNFIKGYPKLELDEFTDIVRLSGADLIEEIDSCYNKYGIENTIVICRSNKRANRFNEGIRRSILWKEEELSTGDLLMIVKNNYYWLSEEDKIHTDFIANGDIVEIITIRKYKELYGFRFADVTVRFLDYPELEIDVNIIIDTLTSETASLSQEQNSKLFYSVMEDYQKLKTKKAKIKAIKENPYFNALQVKFSYSVTCHKAQGGQWNAVFIDQGWLIDDMLDVEYLRWLYTAFTRPIDKLYLVNFNKEFFEE